MSNVNDGPVAVDNSYAVAEGATVSGNLITDDANGAAAGGVDSDADGDTLRITAINGTPVTFVGGVATVAVASGSLLINENGTFTYTHNGSQPAPTSFTYTITDGNGGTSQATATIAVSNVNDLPEGGDRSATIAEDGSYALTAADFGYTDADGDALAGVRIESLATNGRLELNGVALAAGTVVSVADINNGLLRFVPDADEFGSPYGSFTFKVQDAQGTLDDDANTFTLNVTAVNDAPTLTAEARSVSEEGLSDGLIDNVGSPDTTNSASVSGTVQFVDKEGSAASSWSLQAPADALTSGGVPVIWTASANGQTLTGTAGGATVATLSIDGSGNYSFVLSKPLDHPTANVEDNLPLNFTVRASDGQVTSATTLTINVEDDSPSSAQAQAQLTTSTDANIMVILDRSSSMTTTDGVGGTSRWVSAINSVRTLLSKYDAIGDARILIVTFGTDATAQGVNGTGAQWMTVDEARTALNRLEGSPPPAPSNDASVSQGTNYDAALNTAINSYATAGKLGSAVNVSYFISDGRPTYGNGSTSTLSGTRNGDGVDDNDNADDGIQTAEETTWTNFLITNQVDSYALGIGTATTAELDPIAYDGQAQSNRNGIVVTAFSQLDAVLGATVPAPVSGNLLTGSLLPTGGAGADAPAYIRSITVNGITYTYDPKANGGLGAVTASDGNTTRWTFDSTTDILTVTARQSNGTDGGKFIVDMDGGDYRYEVPPAVSTASLVETMGFEVSDKDGDTTGSTLSVTVTKPVYTNGNDTAQTLTGSAVVDIITGGGGNDTISGDANNDELYGQGGNDRLLGGDGADLLHGGAGNDVLLGDAGGDTLVGGFGNDLLTGGAGSDVFRWELADPAATAGTVGTRAADTVTDFDIRPAASGGDVLDLRDLLTGETTANLGNYIDLTYATTGGVTSTTINISPSGAFTGTNTTAQNTHTIVLQGVDLRTLGAGPAEVDILRKLIDDKKLIID